MVLKFFGVLGAVAAVWEVLMAVSSLAVPLKASAPQGTPGSCARWPGSWRASRSFPPIGGGEGLAGGGGHEAPEGPLALSEIELKPLEHDFSLGFARRLQAGSSTA
jgi:hypothetical protein